MALTPGCSDGRARTRLIRSSGKGKANFTRRQSRHIVEDYLLKEWTDCIDFFGPRTVH